MGNRSLKGRCLNTKGLTDCTGKPLDVDTWRLRVANAHSAACRVISTTNAK